VCTATANLAAILNLGHMNRAAQCISCRTFLDYSDVQVNVSWVAYASDYRIHKECSKNNLGGGSTADSLPFCMY
jgi:hypothetical protein